MNLLDKVKKLYNQENSKKFMTNLFIALIIGVIILIAASSLTEQQDDREQIVNGNTQNPSTSDQKNNELINNYSNDIENELEEILSSIKGVGKVKVMVTLEDTAERIPAINTNKTKETTMEKDSEGGTREVIKDDLSSQVVISNNSGDSLVVLKEVKPRVKGVIVVAQGTEDPMLKEMVYRAVKTVLGVSGNKVEVFSSN